MSISRPESVNSLRYYFSYVLLFGRHYIYVGRRRPSRGARSISPHAPMAPSPFLHVVPEVADSFRTARERHSQQEVVTSLKWNFLGELVAMNCSPAAS
jgi:hypothetical protein